MTEDEAKTKWCPFARDSNTGGNRIRYGAGSDDAPPPEYGGEAAAEFPCIASACMAWRWSEAKRTAAFLEAVQRHMAAQPRPNFNTAVQAVYAETGGQFERVEGHCGLAGAPQ
jgi:hypothetical protein